LYWTGARVTLIHRGPAISDSVKYWIKPNIENRIKNGEIAAHFNSRVTRIEPNAIQIATPEGDENIGIQAMDGGAPRYLLNTPFKESGATLSPDGRWVAYMSDETGRREVYVDAYPRLGRKTAVSVAGGVNPVWRPDGQAIYYWNVDQLMVAPVKPGGTDAPLFVQKATVVFRVPYVEADLAMYDVSRDGRFIIVARESSASRLVVTLNALGANGGRRRSNR